MTWLRAAIVVAIGALALQGATRSTPLNPAPPGNEWRVYGHDLANTRYSPLDQIAPQTLADLHVAWRWSNEAGQPIENRNESTPIMVGGTLYFTSSTLRSVDLRREHLVPSAHGAQLQGRFAAAELVQCREAGEELTRRRPRHRAVRGKQLLGDVAHHDDVVTVVVDDVDDRVIDDGAHAIEHTGGPELLKSITCAGCSGQPVARLGQVLQDEASSVGRFDFMKRGANNSFTVDMSMP